MWAGGGVGWGWGGGRGGGFHAMQFIGETSSLLVRHVFGVLGHRFIIALRGATIPHRQHKERNNPVGIGVLVQHTHTCVGARRRTLAGQV